MQYGIETFDARGVSNNSGFFISSGRLIFLPEGMDSAVYNFEYRQGMQLGFLHITYVNVNSPKRPKYRKIYVANNSIVIEPVYNPNFGDSKQKIAVGAYLFVYYKGV